jgi:Fe-S-cluster containining protein
MDPVDAFSYACNQCGRCCRDQVITLSPADVIRIARATALSTGEVVKLLTLRRGSILRFGSDGKCLALSGTRCTIHQGRPLACRLYPLGMERRVSRDHFIRLEPAAGSTGVYGNDGTVAAFLESQGVPEYLAMNTCYERLVSYSRDRLHALVDWNATEPREFRRIAIREALAETNYDPNPLVDAIFDADSLGCRRDADEDTVAAHVQELEKRIAAESDPHVLAAAAVMLAVSLGLSPGVVLEAS